MVRLVVATANQGKAREFREILGSPSGGGPSGAPGIGNGAVEWSDLSTHRDVPTVEETGHTFRVNACIKATHYARELNSWALADDSGLVVDALAGRPGVYSARWAQLNNAGSGDAANNATLLKQLADVPDEKRTARFMCVLALADPKGRIVLTAQDSVEGLMLH